MTTQLRHLRPVAPLITMKISLTTTLLAALTAASASAQTLAPSSAGSSFDSLAPSAAVPIESLVPTSAEPDTTAFPTSTTDSTADPLGDADGEEPIVTLTPTDYNGCMEVGGITEEDELLLATCDASDPMQQLKFVGEQIQLVADSTKCLQAGSNPPASSGKYIRVYPCDPAESLQKFSWDAPNGALTLMETDFAVVFRGVTANVNTDPIILEDLNRPEVFKRAGWSVLA